MIPNTTQTPNIIFNGIMKEMTDTDLRVVLCVVRATFGWVKDKKTGMRKEEDWMNHQQLKNKTGRSGRALSTSIEKCVNKKWIEVRSSSGEILDTKDKRRGNILYYRVGRNIILTSENSSEVKPTSENSSFENSSFENSSDNKRNNVTKKTLLQKDIIIKEKTVDNSTMDKLEKILHDNKKYNGRKIMEQARKKI